MSTEHYYSVIHWLIFYSAFTLIADFLFKLQVHTTVYVVTHTFLRQFDERNHIQQWRLISHEVHTELQNNIELEYAFT
jgi:hypothetical protein